MLLKRLLICSVMMALPIAGWSQYSYGYNDYPGATQSGLSSAEQWTTTQEGGQAPRESARTLGNQSATTQSDSVRQPSGPPACTNGASNWPACTITTTRTESRSYACPAPQSGMITETRTVTVVNGVDGTATAWQYSSDNCASPAPTPTPTCANGASNYPTCTFPTSPPPPAATCANGASNYPTCTFPAPPPACVPSQSGYCSGSDYVTVDSCTGSVIAVSPGACAPPPAPEPPPAPPPPPAPEPTPAPPAVVVPPPVVVAPPTPAPGPSCPDGMYWVGGWDGACYGTPTVPTTGDCDSRGGACVGGGPGGGEGGF